MIGMIGDHDVMLIDVHSQATETLEDVSAVIVRTNGTPVDELYHALVDKVDSIKVIRVGDAVAVRYCDRAIYDGHTAGREI